MAKKVSTQIKDAEVIEDTKVTPEVEEQVSEETVNSQQEHEAGHNKVNWKDKAKEGIAKYRPVIVKTAKIVVGVTAVGLAVLGFKELIGGSEEDLEVIDGEFVEQELIGDDYETTEVESFEE